MAEMPLCTIPTSSDLSLNLRGDAMERVSKLSVGGLCLLLCMVVYAGLSSVNTNLRQMDLDSLALLYTSAAPYALVTPVEFHVRTAVTPVSEVVNDAVPEPAPVEAPSDLLTEYVNLHKTRMESVP